MSKNVATDSASVSSPKLHHSCLIAIGGLGAVYAESALQTWLRLRETRLVKLFLLDVSPGGDLQAAIERARLPKHLRADIASARVADDDAEAYRMLRILLRDEDPSIYPHQIILDLPPQRFPLVVAACRELASEWFYGRRPGAKTDWPFRQLAPDVATWASNFVGGLSVVTERLAPTDAGFPSAQREIPIRDLRACLVTRWSPRRPTALLVGSRDARETFAVALADLEPAAFSFIQLADASSQPEELWSWTRSPDLFFSDESSDTTMALRNHWPEAVWVIAKREDDEPTPDLAFNFTVNARPWAKLPAVNMFWCRSNPSRVTPGWVTQPLGRSAHVLPAAKHYQPIPEMEELRRAWRDESPQVRVLVGKSGCGKTSLVQHFLDECRLTAEWDEQSEADNERLPSADAVFVWDFYAHPHSEKFLSSLADYLAGEEASAAESSSQDCLRRIREGLRVKNIRRALLVLDGMETIQQPVAGRPGESELADSFASDLLEEIASGQLPITALITTRHAPVLRAPSDEGYSCTHLGPLPVAAACNLMLNCGLRGDVEQLAALADRFGRHALTISQLAHMLGDCYDGDLSAVERWPELTFGEPEVGAATEDEKQASIVPLIERYEELLPKPELAILKCLAAAGEPLTAREFAQIFPQAAGATRHVESVAGLTQGEVQKRFEVLLERELVTVHTASGAESRYAMHPTLSRHFAARLTPAAREALSLDAKNYYQRRLSVLAGPGETGRMPSRPMRTRGVIVGQRDVRRNYPTATTLLDTLEKIIFHTARSGHTREARLYYEQRMGGEKHLVAIGQEARARRIGGWLEGYAPA